MKFPNLWDRPFRDADLVRLKKLLRRNGVTWQQLGISLNQNEVRIKAFMAQQNIDTGMLGYSPSLCRNRMLSARSVIRLPAVDSVSALAAPQCSDEIFPLDVCAERNKCKTSWRCLWTQNGIIAVDPTRSSVSLAAFMRYIKWEYADLKRWVATRDDRMLHDTQLYWQKPHATLLKPDEVSISDQFRLGFWIKVRGAVRLFISLGFWDNAFLRLFDQDWWTSFTIKSMIDDRSQFVCCTCIATFNTAIEYEMHGIFHVDGRPRVCEHCYETTAEPKARHYCLEKEAGVSPYPISSSGPNEIRRIQQSLNDPPTTTEVAPQSHKWASVFRSIRFSGDYNDEKAKLLQDGLREEYKAAFSPTTIRWGIVKCGRPSTLPVFGYGSATRALLHDDGSPLPREGRILLLMLSIEGLTTNLQSLVTMRNDLDQLDVQLGFRIQPGVDKINLGQRYVNGIGWSFYSLSSLVDMLLGRVETAPAYEKLIHAWFVINRSKVL